jgi:hypothetical protein
LPSESKAWRVVFWRRLSQQNWPENFVWSGSAGCDSTVEPGLGSFVS